MRTDTTALVLCSGLLLGCLSLASCDRDAPEGPLAATPAAVSVPAPAAPTALQEEAKEPVEIGTYMIRFEHYFQKLGYSIQARNQRLAQFYVHELDEAAAELAMQDPKEGGVPLMGYLRTLWEHGLAPLATSLEEGQWETIDRRYHDLAQSCNTCHAGTHHEFVVIKTLGDSPPAHQDFRPLPAQLATETHSTGTR